MKTMTWLVKREYWENRGMLFWSPLVMSLVMIFFALISIYGLISSDKIDEIARELSVSEHRTSIASHFLIAGGYAVIGGPFIILQVVLVFAYATSTLYDERKDRSIFFWKSLPISDLQTILSKLFIALIGIPLVCLFATIVTAYLILLMYAILLGAHGVSLMSFLLSDSAIIAIPAASLAVLPVNVLWGFVTVSWLMMLSVIVKSRPAVFAILIPVLLAMFIVIIGKVTDSAINVNFIVSHLVEKTLVDLVPFTWLNDEKEAIKLALEGGKSSWETSTKLFEILGQLIRAGWQSILRVEFFVNVVLGCIFTYVAIKLRHIRSDAV